MAKIISKAKANEARKVVSAFVQQEAKKHGKAGAKATAKLASAGLAKIKGLFKK